MLPTALLASSLACACAAVAAPQEELPAPRLLPLSARPVAETLMPRGERVELWVALEDGSVVAFDARDPDVAPREVQRLDGVPVGGAMSDGAWWLAVARGEKGLLVRFTPESDAKVWPLRFAPRAIACGDGRIGMLDTTGVVLEIHPRSGGEVARLPLRRRPAHALVRWCGSWVALSASERSVEFVGGENFDLGTLPRRARVLKNGRLALCVGTPLGGDGVWFYEAALGAPVDRIASAGPVCFDVAEADFDGDGRSDLALLNLGHNQLELRRGRAEGGYGPPHTFAAGQVPERMLIEGPDQDGTLGWFVVQPGPRRIARIRMRRGEERLPERHAVPAAPTALAIDSDAARWVLCEGSPGALHTVGKRESFAATPGRSLVSPARATLGAAELWAYDLIAHELVGFDAEPRVAVSLPVALVDPLGPVAAAGRLYLGSRGAESLTVIGGAGREEDLALGFPLAELLVHAGNTAVAWALGPNGELLRLGTAPTRLPALGAGRALAAWGSPAEPRFALAAAGTLEIARPGAPRAFACTLLAEASAVAVRDLPEGVELAIVTPAAHALTTLRWTAAAGAEGPLGPARHWEVGLGPRDVAWDPAQSSWWVASTFSDEVLRLPVR